MNGTCYLLENLYYVAFIIFTLILVVYTIKTYSFQTKKESTILCKLSVLPNDLARVEQSICLEIYNHGNMPAQEVSIALNGDVTTNIEYVRPEESVILIVGKASRMNECNVVTIQGVEVRKGQTVPFSVSEKGKNTKEGYLQTSLLFLQNEIVQNEDERIAQATEDISKTLERAFDCQNIGPGHNSFRDELCNIAKNIAAKP